jgi:hypothetical protein
MFRVGSHDPFGHLEHKNYGQKKGRELNRQFDSQPLKSRIAQISSCASGVKHTVEKLSTRATILFQTSSQSEVFTR